MLHFLLAALLAIVSQAQAQAATYVNAVYKQTTGACRGGETPAKNAGLAFFRDRDCKHKCNSQASCTGYVLPKSNSNWCETYTSKGITPDGRNFWCYIKTDELVELPPSTYRDTVGACRGGESPGNDAGRKYYSNRNCQTRCNQDVDCTGYVLPVKADKNWCETYTSKGASGDDRELFKCFIKMAADKIQNLCKAENAGQPKHCACYNGYDATCRAITTGEEDCTNANCQFVNDKCKGKAKTDRIKCKKTKWVSTGGKPMCSCLPGCTATERLVKQKVRRRRANKQRKSKFKCKGKSFKFE